MFPFLLAVLTILILILILPTSQDVIHWLKPVGIHTIVVDFDVNHGVSLLFP